MSVISSCFERRWRILQYGSPFYMAMLFLLLSLTGVFYFCFRKKSQMVQKRIILAIMILNVLQHFLKPFLYPEYKGTGFNSLISAYNMCSVLIISSPIVFLWGSRFFKNFLYFVGSAAGIGAIAVPFWYIGKPISQLGWDYGRFYFCHALLFIGSILPLLFGLHKPSYKEFWQVGLGFLLALGVVLINDVVFMSMGLFSGVSGISIYDNLRKINPCWVMGPPPELPWLANLADILTPKVFLGKNPAGNFAPLLWYAVPLYVAISLAAFGLFAVIDRKQFSKDLRRKRIKH